MPIPAPLSFVPPSIAILVGDEAADILTFIDGVACVTFHAPMEDKCTSQRIARVI